MSKIKRYKQTLHNYTLITPTLAVWSALLLTIILVADIGGMIKWFLLTLTGILVICTVVYAKKWSRLFVLYHNMMKRRE